MAIQSVSSSDAATMLARTTAASANKIAAQATSMEKKTPELKQQPVADTVNISSKAKAAASEEAKEPKAEAAKEAAPGGSEE